MGPTWVLSAPDGPHVGPMNLAIRVSNCVNINLCDIFTQPCPNFHGGWAKPQLKLKQGCVITSHIKLRMCLILIFYFQLMVPDKSKFKENINHCLSDYHIPRASVMYASINSYHEGYSFPISLLLVAYPLVVCMHNSTWFACPYFPPGWVTTTRVVTILFKEGYKQGIRIPFDKKFWPPNITNCVNRH